LAQPPGDDARRGADVRGPGPLESSAAAGPRPEGHRDGLAPPASSGPPGARSERACRRGAGPRALSRRGGREGQPRSRHARAWRARARAGRPPCAISAGSRPTLTRRGRHSVDHTLGPASRRRFSRAREAGDVLGAAVRPGAPASAAVARKCRLLGSQRLLKPTCAAEPTVNWSAAADSTARRSRRPRSSPRKGF
jgi:hypothetical protein